MANSVNAVTCIKGEIHSIMTLMRLNTRWSSTRGGRDNYSNDEENLMQPFRHLNEYLGGRFSLEDVDCVMYIMPFHNVVVSNTASGPLTTAALTSLTKFALYGFLADPYPRVQEGITLVASCISRCVYPETDWESDEMILMKLLELSTLCYRSGAARLLTIASAWEMYSTCIAMHNHYKASRILKSDAENALVHLTLSVFGRIATTDPSADNVHTAQELEMLRHRTWESVRDNYNMSSEVGVILLLTKIMVVLSELADLQKHSVETVKFALVLINIALEAGGPSLGLVRPLVEILSNDVCRHLLRASQSEDLAIISLALRVVFNLFVSIKNHMKVQLEVFLISVHLRLIGAPGNGASTPVPGSGTSATQAAYAALGAAREELALESLLEFCREPSLMNDIYVNYDCDMQCTNLFESIITALCTRALPKELLLESSFGGGPRKADGQKATTLGRNVEAASPSQVFSYGSSGGLFGLDAPLAPPAPVGGSNAPLRLSIANRLALDGVLAVLRSLAGQSVPPTVLYSRHSGAPADGAADEAVGAPNGAHGAAGGEDLDQQVDKWCNSGSTSPTSDILSQEGHDGAHAGGPSNGVAGTTTLTYQRHVTTGSRGGDHFGSVTDSPYSSHSTNSRSRSIEPNPVDGENEVTAAVLLARSRHAEMLRERKLMKQKLKLAAEKFNKKPMKADWIRFAMDLGILQPTRPADVQGDGSHGEPSVAEVREPSTGIDATAIAQFLRRTPGLGKTQIGEYISKGPANLHPFHALVLREYVKTFDFSGEHSSFDAALRLFLGEFRLPGESQCIDRLMEAFAGRLFEYLGPDKPFANADAAFILAFSTIMLNTDLHNPQIPQSKKMTKAEFIRNNRGINDNKDLPQEYLERLYDEIKNRQIQVDVDMSDAATAPAMVDLADSTMWNKVLHKGVVDQAPAAFTSTLQARRGSLGPGEVATDAGSTISDASRVRGSSTAAEVLPHSSEGGEVSTVRVGRAPYERDYFLVMSKPVLETLIALLGAVTEDHLISRLLRGLWDYIKICADFGMDATLSSIVQLLCLRTRSLIEAERAVPLRPFTRRNVLAHAAHYRQLQADTGLDLAAFLSLDMEVLLADSDAHGAVPTQSPGGGSEARERQWAYTSLIKGEIMLKLAFHTALLSHPCMREPSWTAVVQLLTYSRGRGALPSVLALVSEGFTPVHGHGTASMEVARLPPSQYAHRCYLEAYGLTLSYPGQNGQRSGSAGDLGSGGAQGSNQQGSSSGGSWLGFLFSDTQSNEHPDRAAMHSGTLDLPNLYCNTNASGCVDMTCEPLRPDDALLRVALQHSHPDDLLFGHRDEEEHFAQTALVLRTLFHSLTDMLEALTTPVVKGPQSSGGVTLFKASLTKDFQSLSHAHHEDDDVRGNHQSHRDGALSLILPSETARNADLGEAFPLHLLEPATSGAKWIEAKELDVVTVLAWAETIVLRDESHIQYFWPDLYGFLRLVLEENVDLVAARCPYFLERCVDAVLRAAIRVVSVAAPTATAPAPRPHRQSILTSSLLQRAATQSVSRQASFDAVWKALRLVRGVPSEVIANLSDRLGAGVLELLRATYSHGLEITADRWFLLFSLLSAATAGPPGRPFVWSALTLLLENDLICETNYTASRHLVLRFAHGVFPGDASEEQRNKISGAASAQKLPGHAKRPGQQSADDGSAGHVVEAISYLLRICLMALAGYGQHRPEVVTDRARPGAPFGHLGGNGTAFSPVASGPSTVAFPLPSVLRAKGRESKPAATKSPLALVTSPNASSGPALPSSGSHKSRDTGALNIGTGTGSGSDKDESVIEVRRVVLQRPEEVEAVWVETCKALADLVSSPLPHASFQASYSLEAVLSAGIRTDMPDTLLAKILGDLVQRLPLAMHSSAGGSHAARAMSVESVVACQRSCNIIFDLVVQKMKVLRDMEPFYAIWARIVTTLAANAMTGAARGHQWWHDEMCDTLEALLRLLRLPVAVLTNPSRGEGKGAAGAEQAVTASSPAAVARTQGTSGGGLFGWLMGPLVAATDAPTVPVIGSKSSVDPEGQEVGLDPSLPLEPSDGYLLKLSWEHICRAYPAFHATLRSRDSKLHGRITVALALPPVYFQKNVTPSVSTVLKPSAPVFADAPQSPSVIQADKGQARTEDSELQRPAEPGLTGGTSVATEPPPAPSAADVEHSQVGISAPDHPPSVEGETPHLVVQQLSASTEGRSLSVSPEHPEEGESLFSVSLTDTPSRPAVQPYDTPLADASISMVLQSPLMDTPSFVSADRSVEGSVDRAVTSPYVKNLTPIFASAEGPSKREGAESMEEAGVSPVRKMDVLVSPEAADRPNGERPSTTMSSPNPHVPVHSHSSAKAASEPATPSQAWQVYPSNTPLASPSPAADSRPAHHARPSMPSKPAIPVRKFSANIQIV